MKVVQGRSALGFRVIGAMKVASGVMLAAAGFGIFRLLHHDLGETLQHTISRLHLDPENRAVHLIAEKVSGVDPAHLKLLGLGTFFYALLHLVEGTGLFLRRRWAAYLTVIATGSLLPVELFEVARKVNALRLSVLAVNLLIVAYLIVRLKQERKELEADEAAS
jgi:uncharacterized membrane protein (DUF2068 family)